VLVTSMLPQHAVTAHSGGCQLRRTLVLASPCTAAAAAALECCAAVQLNLQHVLHVGANFSMRVSNWLHACAHKPSFMLQVRLTVMPACRQLACMDSPLGVPGELSGPLLVKRSIEV
jgi:hypothetical protein